MNKVEIYKQLITEAKDFEYAETQVNNLWEVISYDETLTDNEVETLIQFISNETQFHFTMQSKGGKDK